MTEYHSSENTCIVQGLSRIPPWSALNIEWCLSPGISQKVQIRAEVQELVSGPVVDMGMPKNHDVVKHVGWEYE